MHLRLCHVCLFLNEGEEEVLTCSACHTEFQMGEAFYSDLLPQVPALAPYRPASDGEDSDEEWEDETTYAGAVVQGLQVVW